MSRWRLARRADAAPPAPALPAGEAGAAQPAPAGHAGATQTPLSAVLDAFRSGAQTVQEVRTRSGLSREVVDAAVDYLVRTGRIDAEQLSAGCPSTGCGSCPVGAGGAGCGSTGRTGRSGAVVLTLTAGRQPASSTAPARLRKAHA